MSPAPGPTLRDIHLPPPPSWWPPAPGWWLLAAALLAALAVTGWWLARRWRRYRWRRRIAADLARIAAAHAATPHGPRLASEISQLLRRATLLLDRRAAAFSGEAWLGFLDAQIDGDAFRRGPGRVLLDAPYRRTADVDAAALLKLAQRWLAQALRGPAHERARRMAAAHALAGHRHAGNRAHGWRHWMRRHA
ncbi:MAG TPA: DUF4381 family protein [Rhodanobacteraceae bacterium]|nr:DUF4381 family protein [Rhodanobacteraceae bacterium]